MIKKHIKGIRHRKKAKIRIDKKALRRSMDFYTLKH